MRVLPLVLALALASPSLAEPVVSTKPVENRGNAAPSGAPGVLLGAAAGQTDLCTGVQSVAYGNTMFGVTVDLQHADTSCARIRKAKALAQLGYGAAAVQLLCADREVKAAMQRAGTPCEAVKAAP